MTRIRICHALLSVFLFSTAGVAAAKAADYYPRPDWRGGWRTVRDTARVRKVAGLNTQKLDEALDYAEKTSKHGGLLVVRHGWLAYERYFGKGNREANPDMASVGKAFTSVSCGIMLEEKHDQIPDGLEQKVFTAKYLPEALPLDNPAKADIKLGQLLTMAAGLHGEGENPGYKTGRMIPLEPLKLDSSLGQDEAALRTPLWCKPGEGYSYASASPHIASIVLRHIVGMEMQEYISQRLARPMQWGRWGYALHRDGATLPHTPGGGSIALRSTDALRFGYLLLHEGRWGNQQVVPAEYVRLCGQPSPYDPHQPFSLQFEVNADGHVAGAPRDAFWKSGAGGFGIYVVPSLDMVVYKMAGNDEQYDPARTGLPMLYKYDGSREGWQPGGIGVDEGVRRLIELVAAAVVN